jgi:hypothetical protein
MLTQQKHVVLQSVAPLQLKPFKVGSKMAIAAFTQLLPNQKKQCCKIAQFTDIPCTMPQLSNTQNFSMLFKKYFNCGDITALTISCPKDTIQKGITSARRKVFLLYRHIFSPKTSDCIM